MPARYGLIGCGSSGRNRHLRAASANPRVEPVAVCDLDEERAEDAAVERDALSLSVYTDTVEMIETEALDVVSVATPPGTHHDVVTEIAQTGVSMLVEKPFATTMERTDEMLAACSEHNATVTEVNNQLFYPTVREVKKKIENGDLGEVRNVISVKNDNIAGKSTEGRPGWIDEIPGQLYGESLPHRIYLLRHFLGGISKVQGINTTPSVEGIPEAVGEVEIRVAGENRNGTVVMSLQSNCPELFLIVGSEKSLLLNHEHRFFYTMEKTGSPIHLLKENISNAAEIVYRTGKRSLLYFGTEQLRDRTSIKSLQDFGYCSDGHYCQLTELVEGEKSGLSVKPAEIRTQTKVYETATKAIDEHH